MECISNDSLRSELAAFRLSAHNLEIERGRHFDVSRQNRKCRLCSMGMVESEYMYHFLLVCPLYTDLRRSFLTRSSWPSVAKFINIMSSNSPRFILKLARFINSSNIARAQALSALAVS